MKILFKSDEKIFFIKDDKLDWNYIKIIGDNYDDIPNIEDQPILYHINVDNISCPVYYDNGDSYYIIKEDSFYLYYEVNPNKDYTQVNINNMLNENII